MKRLRQTFRTFCSYLILFYKRFTCISSCWEYLVNNGHGESAFLFNYIIDNVYRVFCKFSIGIFNYFTLKIMPNILYTTPHEIEFPRIEESLLEPPSPPPCQEEATQLNEYETQSPVSSDNEDEEPEHELQLSTHLPFSEPSTPEPIEPISQAPIVESSVNIPTAPISESPVQRSRKRVRTDDGEIDNFDGWSRSELIEKIVFLQGQVTKVTEFIKNFNLQ